MDPFLPSPPSLFPPSYQAEYKLLPPPTDAFAVGPLGLAAPPPLCLSLTPADPPAQGDTWEKYAPLTPAPSIGCLAFSSWLIPLASGLSLSPPQASCRRTFRCLAVSLPRLHSSSPSLTCVTAPPEEPGFAFVGFLFWTCFCTGVCLYPLHTPQQTGSSPTQGQNPFFPSFLSTLGLQVAFLGEKNPKAVPSSL